MVLKKKKKNFSEPLKGFKNNISSNDKLSHQACPVVETAAGVFTPPGARVPSEFLPGLCIFRRVAAGGAVALLLLVGAVLLPVRGVDDLRAVRSVLVAFPSSVPVPAAPALLLCRLLHAAVASRLCWHGDQRTRGLALALLAVGEGVLMRATRADDGLVFAAVRPARGGRAGVSVH